MTIFFYIWVQQLMSNCVVIKPLPLGATIVKVREVFSPFVTEKIIVKEGKAYVKFADAGDINSLYMKYEDGRIPELGNAQIEDPPEDFSWALVDDQEKQKQLKTQDFILPPPKSEQKSFVSQPRFIVIASCDSKVVESPMLEDKVKKIFSKFKIGRILRYKSDIYVEFLDENEIEMLQLQFPGLNVKELGGSVGPTDPNFTFELVRKQVENYERQKQIQKKRQEDRLAEIRRQQAQKEEARRSTGRELSGQFSSWNVRPSGEREAYNRSDASKSQVYWAVVVLLWGIYLMFM